MLTSCSYFIHDSDCSDSLLPDFSYRHRMCDKYAVILLILKFNPEGCNSEMRINPSHLAQTKYGYGGTRYVPRPRRATCGRQASYFNQLSSRRPGLAGEKL